MAFRPIILKNTDLQLGSEADGTDFGIQLTSITLSADVATERLKTVKPAGRFSAVDDPEYSLELGYVFGSDPEGAEPALGDYLMEHNGEEVDFTFRPLSGGPPVYSGRCTLVAGSIGGDQGAFSTQYVTLPVEGTVDVDRGEAAG